jgi:urea transport system ATP-binding protein
MRLEIQDLRSGYGAGPVVDGIDLDVASGELLAIVGRNGMGKSTFVKTVLNYLSDTHGIVRIDGTDTRGSRTFDVARLGVAYAPQEAGLFANLSVRDNIYGGLRGRPDKATEMRLFDRFPLLHSRTRQPAGTLSGGEQKLLLLTRCLLRRPKLLILDEISAGLQPSMVTAVQTVLTEVRAERPMTVVMVEQNVELCTALADRTVVMKLGRLIATVPRTAPHARATLLDHLAP